MGLRTITLLLGADIGDPPATFRIAEAALERRVGRIVGRSRDHWSRAWGFVSDRPFLNRAVQVRTALDADELMDRLLSIESEAGRSRGPQEGYGPRPLDIDVLFLGKNERGTQRVIVPHPRLAVRRFALAPLADLEPLRIHPPTGKTILGLLDLVDRDAQ
ncbi:MAG: 2-amino-4-hydroxy-6-hydroxymethyldihydropteridine diphosphokinase [Flavobacteriales bacterium]|nr:2-amino-4-hydroxy-6-hydroxymethyldihydropteridine diphosphokinase [Flavobacteriales bacterium]